MPPWSALGVFVALAGTVALVIAPWLRPDLQWKDVADAPNHLVRIYVVDAALRRGEWFPRWLPDLYLGYGYPLLNFYAPSTYYVATLLHRVGMTIYASFQWTGALSVALGAGGAYALGGSVEAEWAGGAGACASEVRGGGRRPPAALNGLRQLRPGGGEAQVRRRLDGQGREAATEGTDEGVPARQRVCRGASFDAAHRGPPLLQVRVIALQAIVEVLGPAVLRPWQHSGDRHVNELAGQGARVVGLHDASTLAALQAASF
ncbi:MAG TPA: hypothetical protein VNM48_22610, partial [Chloroflexota bacterium]|nr:hypothetical protein [Chloroflexota bacterium]